ncbi:MAG: hypothetical protein GY803_20460 [Chloroflexi bacterium]|nr:hypothetical protein [Chloroflexota bacterium]
MNKTYLQIVLWVEYNIKLVQACLRRLKRTAVSYQERPCNLPTINA